MVHVVAAASVWADTSLWVTVVGCVCELVAFCATDWAAPRVPPVGQHHVEIGLWKWCDYEQIAEEEFYTCRKLINQPGLPSWYRGAQATITIGFASALLAFFAQALYACSNTFHQSRAIEIMFVVFSYFCVINNMIGLIVYGHFIELEEDLLEQGQLVVSWCFILAGVAAGIIFISGCLGILEILLNPKYARFQDTGAGSLEAREMDNPAGPTSQA